jgi:hypothetical protein
VLKKQRARYDIECGDFGLAGGTVGWVLPAATLGIDKPDEFAACDARFVSGFCIFFNDKQRPLDPRGAEAFVLSLGVDILPNTIVAGGRDGKSGNDARSDFAGLRSARQRRP